MEPTDATAMDVAGENRITINKKQTRRGRGKICKKQGSIKFSIFGNNSNGLKAKLNSLRAAIAFFETPSCITIQESKLRQANLVKLDGYVIFEKNREGLGGGLLTAVVRDLEPVLISDGGEENEILVVQANVGKHKIRIINAYGPQEDEAEKSLSFWQQLEAETISADDENCLTLIQLDANAKVGPEIIQNDPNFQSNNGVLLLEMIKRQNLFLLNASDLCQGKITRHRVTKNSIEMSIIDYVIVCEFLYRKLIKMTIDEERIHTLTKFASTRGVICKSESDHNPLFCQFSIPYTHGVGREERRTIFNLKNSVCQEMFHEVT